MVEIPSFQQYFGLDEITFESSKIEYTNLTQVIMEKKPIKKAADKSITVIYFAFTTLSTVGFGDYYPYSEVERLLGAFMLLFGVAIFSLFMGVFIEIIDKYRAVNADLD